MQAESDRVPSWYATLSSYAWRFVVLVVAGYILLTLVIRLRLVFLPVFIALLIASILVAPVRLLTQRGWKPLPATWLVLLTSIIVIGGILAAIVPSFIDQLGDLGQELRAGTDRVLEWLAEGPLGISEQQVDDYLERAGQQIRENSDVITGGVVSGITKTGEFVTGALLAFVILFFFLKDGDRIGGWMLRQVSEEKQPHVAEMGRRAFETLAAYARGTAIVALVDAVLIGLALVLVGNPLALPLAVITFFASFFPIVGAVLAGIVAALVTLVTNGLVQALIIAGVIIAIQQIEGDVLQPVVVGRLVRLHPLAILLALTAGGIIAGIAGAFVAVPLTAVGATVGNYLKSLDQA